MKGVQLKLQGEWLVMPPGFSIKLQQLNSVFNEEGVFSFPFEVPIEPNRHLFKNISDPFGNVKLKDIDGMEAELWFNGVLLYRGIIETEQEIEFGDTIPMTFLSGNSDFLSKIEGLNAQDIPLDRKIKLGYVVTGVRPRDPKPFTRGTSLPEHIMMNYVNYNVSEPYPTKEFCNVRVCTSDQHGKLKKLEAKRPFSGVCFYLLYFLDCLFKKIGVTVSNNEMLNIDDMKRLAFFSTRCHYVLSEKERDVPLSEIRKKDFCGEFFTLEYTYDWVSKVHINTEGWIFSAKDVFATKENFPDIKVETILEDIQTSFGVRFIYDIRSNKIELIFLKNILNQKTCIDLGVKIISSIVKKNKNNLPVLSYGISDNDSFNYNDYSNAVIYKSYEDILKSGFSRYDKTCFIDAITGNSYRIKVNKETGSDPILFEVANFKDYNPNKNNKEAEILNINYSPIITNYITNSENKDGQKLFAVYADVELNSDNEFKGIIDSNAIDNKTIYKFELRSVFQENYDFLSNNEAPLQRHDAGYALGIMRGAGDKASISYEPNYDGEGNSSWVHTVDDYAFTSDSCDYFGRFFDYNGVEPGGIDQSSRFSLKLVAGKEDFPVGSEYANRGLVDKFLADYFYFLEHKKTVMLEVDMNITQLLNINFLKRYKIGDFVGFINKISYVLTVNGMEEVVIEMYTL